jgi:geranylgeranyl diphosphate synthase type I
MSSDEIRHSIDGLISSFFDNSEKWTILKELDPEIASAIKNFLLSPGKRLRPALFILAYKAYSGKPEQDVINKTCIALELLHSFALIHDDIIDNADTRRGIPSLHKAFEKTVKNNGMQKIKGSDLAMVAGDIIHAMSINIFQSIQHCPESKGKALGKLTETALHTGCGEMLEMLETLKPLDAINDEDIYKIYDMKTSLYTFSCPMAIGAIMAGKNEKEIELIEETGKLLGRAYQLKDDIDEIIASDFAQNFETTRTIPLLMAYKLSNENDKEILLKFADKGMAQDKALQILKNKEFLAQSRSKIKSLKDEAFKKLDLFDISEESRAGLKDYLSEIIGQ